jgi:hypothetical protein
MGVGAPGRTLKISRRRQGHFRTGDAPEPDTTNLGALIASLNGLPERFQIAGPHAQPG